VQLPYVVVALIRQQPSCSSGVEGQSALVWQAPGGHVPPLEGTQVSRLLSGCGQQREFPPPQSVLEVQELPQDCPAGTQSEIPDPPAGVQQVCPPGQGLPGPQPLQVSCGMQTE
jgi:hypothetical protein